MPPLLSDILTAEQSSKNPESPEMQKRVINAYKKRYVRLFAELFQSNKQETKKLADTIESIFHTYKGEDHFWFVVSKKDRQFHQNFPQILEQGTSQQVREQELRHEILVLKDAIEQLNLESESRTDHLTGLPNKKKFQEDLIEFSTYPKQRKSLVLYIDLDKIKKANDEYGHEKTDEIIKEIALRLQKKTHDLSLSEDCACSVQAYRIGGDEMAIFIHERDPGSLQDKDKPQQVIRDILNTVTNDVYDVRGHVPWAQEISCGAALLTDQQLEEYGAGSLIEYLDLLQYATKLTTGEARTPPTTEVQKKYGALLEWYKEPEHQRKNDKWVLALSTNINEPVKDIITLYDTKPLAVSSH